MFKGVVDGLAGGGPQFAGVELRIIGVADDFRDHVAGRGKPVIAAVKLEANLMHDVFFSSAVF